MNDDVNTEQVEQLRNETLDFLVEKLEKENMPSQVVLNAVLNILIQMVHIHSSGDVEVIRGTADRIKSAIIDYGVANESEQVKR